MMSTDPTTNGLELRFEHVSKRYGDRTVVDDLCFAVRPGRVTGFLGPNGAGKSTSMKILLDLAAADGGRATIGGVRYRRLADPARTVGVVLEPNAFHPGRSARNHLRVLADATGASHRRVEELLEEVGLADAADRRVGAFSLGMKQRLSLAGALLGDPPVLVLDEPANGLDPQGIRDLREQLRSRALAGGTVLVSSHLLGEAEHLVDDVVVLRHGRLVTTGSLHELQQTSAMVRTPTPEALRDVVTAAGGSAVVRDDDVVVVRGLALEAIGDRAFAAGIVLHELAPRAGSLEELFLGWTSDPSSPPADHAVTVDRLHQEVSS
jgi:ABC-2 type transport system ATP-binding protein